MRSLSTSLVGYPFSRLTLYYRSSLWTRLQKTCPPLIQRRIVESLEDFFQGLQRTTFDRTIGAIPDIEDYISRRRETSICRLAFLLIEYAHGMKLPRDVYNDPIIVNLTSLANDLMSWSNVRSQPLPPGVRILIDVTRRTFFHSILINREGVRIISLRWSCTNGVLACRTPSTMSAPYTARRSTCSSIILETSHRGGPRPTRTSKPTCLVCRIASPHRCIGASKRSVTLGVEAFLSSCICYPPDGLRADISRSTFDLLSNRVLLVSFRSISFVPFFFDVEWEHQPNVLC